MREDDEKGGFLARWSRRKDAVRRGETADEHVARDSLPEGGVPVAGARPVEPTPESGVPPGEPDDAGTIQASAADRTLTEADFAEVDFSALSESSDFTRFLGPRVPEVIRQKALARLWQTDPAFSTADVLHDYTEDFTDAAKAVPGIASSWKFGQGYLSDEEVAAWDALGKPPAEADAATGEKAGDVPVGEAKGGDVASADGPHVVGDVTKPEAPYAPAEGLSIPSSDETPKDANAVAAPATPPSEASPKA